MERRDVTRMGTCCYCGSRTLLELTARGGHELACGACGAPIHVMKGVKTETAAKPKKAKPTGRAATGAAAGMAMGSAAKAKAKAVKKGKKSVKRKAKGVFDLFEDVFDEVFDLFD